MSSDEDVEIPELDFRKGVQPHRFAELRSGYKFTVHLERELWEHFGSEEAVIAALRGLVDVAKHLKPKGKVAAARPKRTRRAA